MVHIAVAQTRYIFPHYVAIEGSSDKSGSSDGSSGSSSSQSGWSSDGSSGSSSSQSGWSSDGSSGSSSQAGCYECSCLIYILSRCAARRSATALFLRGCAYRRGVWGGRSSPKDIARMLFVICVCDLPYWGVFRRRLGVLGVLWGPRGVKRLFFSVRVVVC